uniref:Integrase catalytic domain-containing protein n=1 Tax=Salix viminalis TaxID=40686 RepID=A0A6N2MUI5_SALVM
MAEEEKGRLKAERPKKAHYKKDKGGVKQLLAQKKFKKWRIYADSFVDIREFGCRFKTGEYGEGVFKVNTRVQWEECSKGPYLNFMLHEGYLFKNNCLCIPECSLREIIVQEAHGGGLGGHFGRDKTLALVQENFYWPKMVKDVTRHVERCGTCHRAKSHAQNTGLYTPLPVPAALWEDVSMDFIVGLPRTQRNKDSIMVVVDHRDPKFVSHFWRTLWRKLGTSLQFSSSHHPQTDGQTEVVNRSLGNLLRSLVGSNIRQWDLILAQAEFAYNRSTSQTTGTSPFEVVYGQNPHGPLDLVPLPITHHFSGDAADQAKCIQKLHEQVRARIIKQNERYRNTANKHRKPAAFKEGDLPRADGPFKVLHRIGENAYKIELPEDYGVSTTFNVADLYPYHGDAISKGNLLQPREHEKEIEERWASNQRDLEQGEQKRRANILIKNGRRGIMQRGVSRREGEDEEETEE